MVKRVSIKCSEIVTCSFASIYCLFTDLFLKRNIRSHLMSFSIWWGERSSWKIGKSTILVSIRKVSRRWWSKFLIWVSENGFFFFNLQLLPMEHSATTQNFQDSKWCFKCQRWSNSIVIW
jgi:hypothetical protein